MQENQAYEAQVDGWLKLFHVIDGNVSKGCRDQYKTAKVVLKAASR